MKTLKVLKTQVKEQGTMKILKVLKIQVKGQGTLEILKALESRVKTQGALIIFYKPMSKDGAITVQLKKPVARYWI